MFDMRRRRFRRRNDVLTTCPTLQRSSDYEQTSIPRRIPSGMTRLKKNLLHVKHGRSHAMERL